MEEEESGWNQAGHRGDGGPQGRVLGTRLFSLLY